MRSFLLKIAYQVVAHVVSELNRLIGTVVEQVMNPMRAMVQQVTGGMWRGDGANAFVEAVNNLAMPNVQIMNDQISDVVKKLNSATTIMQQADAKAGQSFNGLGDVFGKIF